MTDQEHHLRSIILHWADITPGKVLGEGTRASAGWHLGPRPGDSLGPLLKSSVHPWVMSSDCCLRATGATPGDAPALRWERHLE
jgi:Ni,Fe-hydrogenase I large subunit